MCDIKMFHIPYCLSRICQLSMFFFFNSCLCEALQQAGRNPSYATLNKYWTPKTSTLNFDDFCEILKCEKKIEETDLLRAFRKMDESGDGSISHSELEKALTTVSSTRTAAGLRVQSWLNCCKIFRDAPEILHRSQYHVRFVEISFREERKWPPKKSALFSHYLTSIRTENWTIQKYVYANK